VFADTDRRGEPLTFTTPIGLRRLRIPEHNSQWNQAILAFLLALPPDARIILFWC
jgi:hypothetical protein